MMKRLDIAGDTVNHSCQQPFQIWGDGPIPSALFFHEEGGYRIRFPSVADFLVSHDGLKVDALPVSPDAPWQGIYEQQVRPLLLSLRGAQVFHGAAVRVGDAAIGFLGSSGRGKSTLTTAFARRGYPFMGDDCLQLEIAASGVSVLPQSGYIRLWGDSMDRLADGKAVHVAGSPKPRLLAGETLPHCDRTMPLARVYLLAEAVGDMPAIEAMPSSAQLIGWTANAFVLDIRNPEVLRRNLSAAARLVRDVPMSRLCYPRRYDVLDAAVDAVLMDVHG